MKEYPGTPSETHLKIYKKRIEIPDYLAIGKLYYNLQKATHNPSLIH